MTVHFQLTEPEVDKFAIIELQASLPALDKSTRHKKLN